MSMLSRNKPYFDIRDLAAALSFFTGSAKHYERLFAKAFGYTYALHFPYGRDVLYALLKALPSKKKEVVMPDYTCMVMPNAAIKANHTLKVVDVSLEDYNAHWEHFKKAITKNTKVIVPTHLFGFTVDVKKIKRNMAKDIIILEDVALALDPKIGHDGDAALFSTGFNKHITTLQGGILATDDKNIYEKVLAYRNKAYRKPSCVTTIRRFITFFAYYFVFNRIIYGLLDYANARFGLLKRIKRHNYSKIMLPKDHFELFSKFQTRVGVAQLKKYKEINKKRMRYARRYHALLEKDKRCGKSFFLVPFDKHSTYSHFPIRVKNRDIVRERMKAKGIEAGTTLDYHTSGLPAYKKLKKCPHSAKIASEIINLPNYPSLKMKDIDRIAKVFLDAI